MQNCLSSRNLFALRKYIDDIIQPIPHSLALACLAIRCNGILLSACLLSGTVFLSHTVKADHLSNESTRTVDIPTVIKAPKEDDFPTIELLGYKVSRGGVTVSLRATNESRYRATVGLCEVLGHKGDERSDRTFVNFYNQLGPGFNMLGSANFYISKNSSDTWNKSEGIVNIERLEISCDWTMRYEPSDKNSARLTPQ